MKVEAPLDDLFRSRGHVRVLRALFALPDGLYASAREVARRAGVSHPTASSVLSSLADQGLVRVTRRPRADLFDVNRDHTASAALRPLFDWDRQIGEELLADLRRLIEREAPSVSDAYLFGSAARGEAGPTSDVDIALVCPPARADAVEAAMEGVADAVRLRYGLRINALVGTEPIESLRAPRSRARRIWRRIAAEGVPFIQRPGRERRRG